MRLHALLAAVPHSTTISVTVQPDDTIATALERIAQELNVTSQPDDAFTAFLAKHNDQWTLGPDAPDRMALQTGDTTTVAKYTTPAARLDPTKTVADYVGRSEEMPEDAVAIVLLSNQTESASALQHSDNTLWSKVEQLERTVQQHTRDNKNWLKELGSVKILPQKVLDAQSGGRHLTVVVAGVRDLGVSVVVHPHDTIEHVRRLVMTDACVRLCKRIRCSLNSVFKFTLYTAKQHGEWPLHPGAADRIALENNDPDVMARYMVPSARLKWTDTVADHFDENDVALDTAAAMVLWWAPASVDEYRFIRAQLDKFDTVAVDEQCVTRRKNKVGAPTKTAEPRRERRGQRATGFFATVVAELMRGFSTASHAAPSKKYK